MLDILPSTHQLSSIFSEATAPAFFLGSVAAFVSLMSVRSNEVYGRIRQLNMIYDTDSARSFLKADILRLRRRINLLKIGILTALGSAFCATFLLFSIFISEFMQLNYNYGGGALFGAATALLSYALLHFIQDVRISFTAADEIQ